MTKSAAGCKELCCSKRLRAGACFLEQPCAKTRHNICKEKTGFRQTEIAMIKFKRAGLACVLLIASSLAQGPTTFHPGFNFFSRQQDVQLGQESADFRLRSKWWRILQLTRLRFRADRCSSIRDC